MRAETGKSISSQGADASLAEAASHLVAARRARQALRVAWSRADQPGIADMTRQAAFRHQHDAEAHRQSGLLPRPGEEVPEGAGSPAPGPAAGSPAPPPP